jgi:phage gp36-like protein
MAYATNSDVQQRIGAALYVQLTDDAGSGSADEDVVTEARAYAEAEVNSYLGRRFAVPVDVSEHAELAALLRSLTLDLAEYRLHARRAPVPADIVLKRAAAVHWLEAAARGDVVLPAAAEVSGNAAIGVEGQVRGAPRRATRESLEDL